MPFDVKKKHIRNHLTPSSPEIATDADKGDGAQKIKSDAPPKLHETAGAPAQKTIGAGQIPSSAGFEQKPFVFDVKLLFK